MKSDLKNTDHKNTKSHFDPELLDKFYRGNCTPKEKEMVEEWFTVLNLREAVTHKAREEWDRIEMSKPQDSQLHEILYKIHYHLRLEEFTKEREGGKIIRLKRMVAAAAVGIILIVSGYWFGNTHITGTGNEYVDLHSTCCSLVHFELPDGSGGWLNSMSSLRYPVKFTGEKRIVVLKGEGYFEVKHNASRPFIVETGNIRIIALGTSFNVQAYENEAGKEVTLVNGKVVIEKKLVADTYKQILELKPGEHVQLDAKTGKITAMEEEVGKYIAWKDGKLLFRNDPLSKVITGMSRFYNVDIEVGDKDLYKYHFHATFEDETLFEALRLLTLSTPMSYKILKREKNPDGSYKKRKVILYKR